MSVYEADRRPPHDPALCTRAFCGRCKPAGQATPPPPVDRELRPSPGRPDAVVAGIGLASHPPMRTLANDLRDLADQLDAEGEDAEGMASLLASRGWGSSTLGDGRRGKAALTTPEAEAAKVWPQRQNGTRWFGADVVYSQFLADVARAVSRTRSYTADLMSHASDEDRTVTGSGECRACARFCDPGRKAGNRLVKSMCPTCYRAWRRYEIGGGSLIRQDWISQRRESFTERDTEGRPVCVHTPEPDHDLDLSSEHIGELIDAETADSADVGSEQGDP